jgi:hypothetical protein
MLMLLRVELGWNDDGKDGRGTDEVVCGLVRPVLTFVGERYVGDAV